MNRPRLYYALRATQWRQFFKKNGPRTWFDLRFTGFRESPNDFILNALWVGITNTGLHYYASMTIDCNSGKWKMYGRDGQRNYLLAKQEEGKRFIETFLDPNCRCRLGFHWKCSVHGGWEN